MMKDETPSSDTTEKTSTATGSGRIPEIKVVSFGYKNGAPPLAHLLVDVRFLKNPYWVEELRPLTGKDADVQRYVLDQPAAIDLLDRLVELIASLAPAMLDDRTNRIKVALGCTGGQHRSTALVEELSKRVALRMTGFKVLKFHRELDSTAEEISVAYQAAEAGR